MVGNQEPPQPSSIPAHDSPERFSHSWNPKNCMELPKWLLWNCRLFRIETWTSGVNHLHMPRTVIQSIPRLGPQFGILFDPSWHRSKMKQHPYVLQHFLNKLRGIEGQQLGAHKRTLAVYSPWCSKVPRLKATSCVSLGNVTRLPLLLGVRFCHRQLHGA